MLFKLRTDRKGFQKNTGHVPNRVSMFFQASSQSLSMTLQTQPVSAGKAGEDQGKHHQIQTDQSTIFLHDEDPVLFQEQQKVPAEEEQVLSASLLLQFKFRRADCCPQLK